MFAVYTSVDSERQELDDNMLDEMSFFDAYNVYGLLKFIEEIRSGVFYEPLSSTYFRRQPGTHTEYAIVDRCCPMDTLFIDILTA